MPDVFKAAARAAMNQELPAELFSGLLAIAADAVIAVDEEQRIIFFNEGAERIFGWTAAEVGGQYLAVLLPDRFRAAHHGHVHGFGEAHGRARLMGERQQISGLRKSGEEFPAEAAIQRIEVQGRQVYAAVLRDISARQRAEEALLQAIKARDDMMGIVSHDLRNPANAVKMLARSIVEGDSDCLTPDIVERVEIIRQAAEQIDALIQDLLDVTRLEGARLAVRRQAESTENLVQRSISGLRPIADAGGVTLRTELSRDVGEIDVDAERIIQLFSNIVGNAIKFTPAGGMVTISARPRDDMVVFNVRDGGEGIDATQLPHVFDRFYQATRTARRGARHGAGLGLAIAKGIVEAHGGSITIRSVLGEGTDVEFELPRAVAR